MSSREKAKQIILAIIEESGGTFCGTVRLYKAFWCAHLCHWINNEGILSDHPIVRMANGPGIDEGLALLGELKSAGLITETVRPKGKHEERVFTIKATTRACVSEVERQAIRDALKRIGDRTGKELSRIAHDYSRNLETVPEGQEFDLYHDVLSETEAKRIAACVKESGAIVDKIFGIQPGPSCQTA